MFGRKKKQQERRQAKPQPTKSMTMTTILRIDSGSDLVRLSSDDVREFALEMKRRFIDPQTPVDVVPTIDGKGNRSMSVTSHERLEPLDPALLNHEAVTEAVTEAGPFQVTDTGSFAVITPPEARTPSHDEAASNGSFHHDG
ncbi:hypothetical protein ACIB24_14480 [Spongisporangium articulatum]|uniref:Uncharacterized protein n=1 Tax=Spongisporangium articulatum TaxID=3362603 RepID=A0ABW8ARN2_9ACTN